LRALRDQKDTLGYKRDTGSKWVELAGASMVLRKGKALMVVFWICLYGLGRRFYRRESGTAPSPPHLYSQRCARLDHSLFRGVARTESAYCRVRAGEIPALAAGIREEKPLIRQRDFADHGRRPRRRLYYQGLKSLCTDGHTPDHSCRHHNGYRNSELFIVDAKLPGH